jgi:hypothetical protein
MIVRVYFERQMGATKLTNCVTNGHRVSDDGGLWLWRVLVAEQQAINNLKVFQIEG